MRTALILVTALAAAWLPRADAAERSGADIVKSKCASCHETGKHGAPRIGDREAWVPRLKRGLDATVIAAIRGHGSMPARGGLAEITDAELRAAVLHLFNPAGPPPKPAPPPPLGPNQKIVDGTEVYLGLKPVRDGVYHLTVTLRDTATHAVVGDAQVEVTVSNPVMGDDTRKLDRTSVDKVVSYGNDFRISGREPHAITVHIRRPGNPRLIETRFDFKG